jgi:hypothetical protein
MRRILWAISIFRATPAAGLRHLAEVQDMILIDCMRVLGGLPKSRILQHDGFHLSPVGHQVVGQAIAQSIAADAKEKQSQGLETGASSQSEE